MSSIQPDLVIDRYELFQIVGQGGMAAVHLARQRGGVGFSRVVAVKRLHPQLATVPDFVAMFLDEARLAARVRHTNVVETLDVVEAGNEILMVMELVVGSTLSNLLRLGAKSGEQLPIPVVLSIAVGMLRGLHAAHEASAADGTALGIIHRDVSPHNVIVGLDGIARVLDFGVAKAEGQIHSTRTGELRGKLAYMAPEHLRDQATTLSDVYSAGVVLWEALTGRRLFTATSDGALVTKVLDGNIPAIASVAPDVPEELALIVHRALAMSPADRFESAAAMADALEDACELAKPGEVALLVTRVARADIDQLRGLIAVVEAEGQTKSERRVVAAVDAPIATPVTPPKLLDGLRRDLEARKERGEATLTGAVDRPTLTDAGVAPDTLAPSPAASLARQTSGARVLVAAIALFLVGAVLWASFWRPSGNAPSAPAEAAAATEVPTMTGEAPHPTAAPSMTAIETAMASTPAVTASLGASVAVAPRGPFAGGPKTAATSAAPPPSSECDKPYEIDQNGVKRIKVKCYKVTQ